MYYKRNKIEVKVKYDDVPIAKLETDNIDKLGNLFDILKKKFR